MIIHLIVIEHSRFYSYIIFNKYGITFACSYHIHGYISADMFQLKKRWKNGKDCMCCYCSYVVFVVIFR
jgi:hypothetical protein